MRTKAPPENALSPAQRARLLALAEAAEGCDWDSRQIAALARYYRELTIPWHLRAYVGGHVLTRREMGAAADAGAFVAGAHRLAACVDFGDPFPCRRCAGCRRRERLGQYVTFAAQQAYESEHGSVACERGPRFEADGDG
jgi:hypothetical protein